MKWKLGSAVIVFLGFSVLLASGNQEPTGQLEGSPVSCDRGLYDTHAHWENDAAGQKFAARMDEHNVSCTVLFTPMDDLYERPDYVRRELSGEGGFVLFIMTPDREFLTESWMNRVYKGNQQHVGGIGEVVFYDGPMQGTSLTSEPWPSMFEHAAENDLPLMLHPVESQVDQVETMLSRYPNTTVVLHGGELSNTGRVPELLREYDNMYWQVDVATIFSGRPLRQDSPEEFVNWYEKNREERLESGRRRVVSLMNASPDRVMWGTDIGGHAWSVEPEVYSRMINFSNDLVASLPEKYRAKYAHGNAARLFGNATRLSEPPEKDESLTKLVAQLARLPGEIILTVGQQATGNA